MGKGNDDRDHKRSKKKDKRYAEMLNDESSIPDFGHGQLNQQHEEQQAPPRESPTKTNTTTNTKRFIALYDYDCMIAMESSVACGYITLLSGGATDGMDEYPQHRGGNNKRHQKAATSNDIRTNPTMGSASTADTKASIATAALSFAAIMEGNVIDACFGIGSKASHHAQRSIQERIVKDAKSAIGDAVATNEGLKSSIVSAYQDAFQCVVNYHCHEKAIPLPFRCFGSSSRKRQASDRLQQVFQPIECAIQDTL